VTPSVATAVVIGLAELAVRGGVVSTLSFPPPSSAARALYDEVQTASLWIAIGRTLQGWALGLGLATAAAVPLGIAIGTNRYLYKSVRFVIDFLRPIPSIALLPLFILLFGVGMPLKVYMTALGAFWPLFFQTMYGVQDVDPVVRDTARAYGLNRFMRFVFVSLPGATPYIATGLRISASIALLVAVGAEMVVGVPGLGHSIFRAQYAGQPERMYALVAVSGVIGVLLAIGFNRLERLTLKWHPSQRREVVV
jgi:ABC-type nitrate/sulfonate/bicarbonate transport system permease component